MKIEKRESGYVALGHTFDSYPEWQPLAEPAQTAEEALQAGAKLLAERADDLYSRFMAIGLAVAPLIEEGHTVEGVQEAARAAELLLPEFDSAMFSLANTLHKLPEALSSAPAEGGSEASTPPTPKPPKPAPPPSAPPSRAETEASWRAVTTDARLITDYLVDDPDAGPGAVAEALADLRVCLGDALVDGGDGGAHRQATKNLYWFVSDLMVAVENHERVRGAA